MLKRLVVQLGRVSYKGQEQVWRQIIGKSLLCACCVSVCYAAVG
jgi:hypothetical protein